MANDYYIVKSRNSSNVITSTKSVSSWIEETYKLAKKALRAAEGVATPTNLSASVSANMLTIKLTLSNNKVLEASVALPE